MTFCSYCGFLQPPNVTTCPRCGTPVTPDQGAEGHNANEQTIITAPDKTEPSGGYSGSQPGLLNEPNQFVGYNSQTQRVEQGENTPVPTYMQNMPFPGSYQQTSVPPPLSGHISRSDSNFSTTEGGSYPGYIPGPVFPAGRGTLPPPSLSSQTKSNAAPLVMLLVLFLVLITVVATTIVFVIGPDKIFQMVSGGGVASQPTAIQPTSPATAPTQPTPTSQVPTPTSTLTPNQQAQSVITRYYIAINGKDYQTAYNLWVNYPDTYQNFADGFSDTQHDDYQFGQILPQSDGTVQVNITLVATSTSSQQTTYQGYYIVGQQSDGSWKIVKASMKAV